MKELRHDSEQDVHVGVFLEKNKKGCQRIPYSGLQLDWCYWRYLIKADGAVVDIVNRTWSGIPNCAGLYFLTLLASDVDQKGPLTIYIHDDGFLGKPVMMSFMIVDKNVYDSKYGNSLLKVETEPQGE